MTSASQNDLGLPFGKLAKVRCCPSYQKENRGRFWGSFRALILLVFGFSPVSAEDFSDAIRAYLQDTVEARDLQAGIVVGLVDEHGTKVIGFGKMDRGTDLEVNGDTIFEIGSDTKTFTALLLQDMVARGAMKLDDPVAKFLPESVTVPTRNGAQITLGQLATHTSGLPAMPDNLDPKRADNPYADYTVAQLYAFLSNHKLAREPGTKSEYSNLGMGLLGHIIAMKAGMSYESLVVDRICRPLKMDDTRITLPPEWNARFAVAHNQYGEAVPYWDAPTLGGAGALRSTANDLLKYVSANLGLPRSSLTPLMEETHRRGLGWFVMRDEHGAVDLIYHGGGTGGHRTFTGFDPSQKRGVVIMCNAAHVLDSDSLGKFLLHCEWQSPQRATATNTASQNLDRFPGQYRRCENKQAPFFNLRQLFSISSVAIVATVTCAVLLIVTVLLRFNRSSRKRWLIAGAALLIGGFSFALVARTSNPVVVNKPCEPGIGIRREGNRLFAHTASSDKWPISAVLPSLGGELMPESDMRFYQRLSGRTVAFSQNAQAVVTGFTATTHHGTFDFEKISDQPPEPPKRVTSRVPVKLDTKLLESCVGKYDFPPEAGFNGFTLTIWREGDQLFARAAGNDVIPGAFEIYPQSEATFFNKVNDAQFTFLRDDEGKVISLRHHLDEYPDVTGTKRALGVR